MNAARPCRTPTAAPAGYTPAPGAYSSATQTTVESGANAAPGDAVGGAGGAVAGGVIGAALGGPVGAAAGAAIGGAAGAGAAHAAQEGDAGHPGGAEMGGAGGALAGGAVGAALGGPVGAVVGAGIGGAAGAGAGGATDDSVVANQQTVTSAPAGYTAEGIHAVRRLWRDRPPRPTVDTRRPASGSGRRGRRRGWRGGRRV